MHRRINAHWRLVGVFARDFFIHVEQVAIALANFILAETFDGVGEIEVNAEAARTDAAPLVAHFLGRARGDVARREIAEARILAL